MITRRGFVSAAAFGAASLCGGCGFHPIYARDAAARRALPAIYVNLLANRGGQLLRQALQARLDGTDDAVAKRFALTVAYGESLQVVNVQEDNSVTRLRNVGTATWTLLPYDGSAVKLAGGTVRSVDGYNVIDEQFFYQNLEEEAVERRLADALADQIVLGLSVYFDKHPKQAAG
jgi:LPS-assembly lipoprotein